MQEKKRLVLTRKPGQSVMIGNDIEVYVSKLKGNQVVLSFRAPENFEIWRKELYLKIKRENSEKY